MVELDLESASREELLTELRRAHGQLAEMAELKAEQERTARELRAQKDFLQLLVNTLPDMIFIKDVDLRVTMVNDTYCDMVGGRREWLIGKRAHEIHSDEVANTCQQSDEELLRSGESVRGEEWLTGPDGRRILLDTIKVPYRGADGDIAGIMAISRDITERKAAEEEREALIGDLTKALSEIKHLTGLIPMCASCKRIRNDDGFWDQVETYIQRKTRAVFTHGICPACMDQYYGEYSRRGE